MGVAKPTREGGREGGREGRKSEQWLRSMNANATSSTGLRSYYNV